MKDYYLTQKEYVDSKIVTMDYIDIKNKLKTVNNSHFSISDAYIKNGMVCIVGDFKAGIVGGLSGTLLPAKYFPIADIYAQIFYSRSVSDNNKIQSFSIDKKGGYYIWVSASLDKSQHFQFIYPLK